MPENPRGSHTPASHFASFAAIPGGAMGRYGEASTGLWRLADAWAAVPSPERAASYWQAFEAAERTRQPAADSAPVTWYHTPGEGLSIHPPKEPADAIA